MCSYQNPCKFYNVAAYRARAYNAYGASIKIKTRVAFNFINAVKHIISRRDYFAAYIKQKAKRIFRYGSLAIFGDVNHVYPAAFA